jgi:cephalosporin hydroxylase
LPRPWIVIEDSSHHYRDTLAVLRFFDPYMRSAEYIVVEDGNVSDMGNDGNREGGPCRAISEFLMRNPACQIDASYATATATTSLAIRTAICAKSS